MKKIIFVTCIALALSMLAGCASNDGVGKSATAMAKKAGAPDWYFQGNYKDSEGIYGVGASNYKDPLVAEKAARVDGRALLAQMVSSAVSYIGTNSLYMEGESAESQKEFNERATVVADQVLVGSMQVDRFDLDGEVRVLMFQPYDDLMKKLKSNAMKQDNEKLRELMETITLEQFVDALENTSAR